MIIRKETIKDYRKVEELIKKAFWNINVPGCVEHHLAHQMRKNPSFVPELSFVLEDNGMIIGVIMYAKAILLDEENKEKDILSFGPFAIHPDYQRRGYGRMLLDYSFNEAQKMNYDTVIIFGNPENYVCYGFKNCSVYDISFNDSYPVSLMVKALKEDLLKGRKWRYIESPAHEYDATGFENFDSTFEQMEKGYKYSQELFSIYVKSFVNKH